MSDAIIDSASSVEPESTISAVTPEVTPESTPESTPSSNGEAPVTTPVEANPDAQ